MTTRVLIVDDQLLVRAGFRMILEAEEDIEIVGEAADGLTAVLAARETEPDVTSPPTSATRSRRPARPWPPSPSPPGSERPSFAISSSSSPACHRIGTQACAGPAYLRAFVSASWMTR